MSEEKISLENIKSAHFIGIGGIGISAIARMLLLRGVRVSGSDQSDGEVIDELRKAGAVINTGHSASNLPEDAELVIYTIAIPDSNPELVEARNLGISLMTYPETLTAISESRKTIAVAGTHGKTTTTGMTAHVLVELGEDPTVVVGSFLKTANGGRSNFIAGKGEYFVVEACEYKKSFLNITPTIAIITNIEEDHLDFYKDIEDIKNAFFEFASRIKKNGALVVNLGEANSREVAEKVLKSRPDIKILDYSGIDPTIFHLKIPGQHNRLNASAVLAVTKELGMNDAEAAKSLENFSGTWRRFEYKGRTAGGAVVYDDYGHHPTELTATIAGASELFPDKKIVVVFQPHQYSRTKLLLDDFARAFRGADSVYILPIYAAREAPDPEVSSEILTERIRQSKTVKNVSTLASFEEAQNILEGLGEDSVCIVMGAGDITEVANNLTKGSN